MLPLDVKEVEGCNISLRAIGSSTPWHKRYRHLNYNILKQLHSDNLVNGPPTLNGEGDCGECLFGKQTRRPFHVGRVSRATVKL